VYQNKHVSSAEHYDANSTRRGQWGEATERFVPEAERLVLDNVLLAVGGCGGCAVDRNETDGSAVKYPADKGGAPCTSGPGWPTVVFPDG
jgi:hypothetical protein